MLNLLPMLIAPLIIFLSSCKDNFPQIQPKERCVVVLSEKNEDSFKGYCRCHMYSWSITGIGRITESQNYDLQKCNKLVGFSAEDSVKIYEWEESIRLWLNRHMGDI